MTALLIGTDDGVFALSEKDGAWQTDGPYLKGREVHSLSVAGAGGETAFAATRGDGLFRLDLTSGDAEVVGAGVLPEVQRCVAVSPHDPNVVFLGTEPAAFYRSNDGGDSWSECKAVAELVAARKWLYPVKTIPPHIRFILPDWNDPETIYAAGQVGGILKSVDGGKTWVDFISGIDPDVHSIAQDPRDPQTIYIVTGGGGDIVNGYPPAPPQGRPIYRSSDGGKSWQCLTEGFERTYGIQMVIDPRDPGRMVTAVARGIPSQWTNRPEMADATIVHSADGGATWGPVTGDLPERFNVMIEAMTATGTDKMRVFFATGGQVAKRFEGVAVGEIYGSDAFDSGWKKLPLQLPSIFCMAAL